MSVAQSASDACGAGGRVRHRRRGALRGAAGEDPPPARRVAGAGGIVGTCDLDALDRRVAVVEAEPAQREPGQTAFEHARRLGPGIDERDAHRVRPGRGPEAHDETGVRLVGDVVLPGRVAADRAEEAVGRRIADAVRVPDGEAPDEGAVEAHLDAVRAPHADDVVVDHPPEPDADLVVAVEREVVPHGQAAARAERKLVAGAVVLVEQARRAVGGRRVAGANRRVAHRETADAAGGRQVALEQGGGDRQHLAVGVEALRVDVVGREQQPALVDVEGQQVADRVAVLGRREAAHRGPARIGCVPAAARSSSASSHVTNCS